MDAKERVAVASEIVRRYDPTIRSCIRSYVQNEQDADDVYQDVFLSLVRSPPRNFTFMVAYLHRIIRNHVADMARRRGCRTRFTHDCCPDPGGDEPTSVDPVTLLVETEETQMMEEFLESVLPPHMANVLMERCGRGNSTSETAQKLGLKKRSVSRYYCVAVQRIRQMIREQVMQEGTACRY